MDDAQQPRNRGSRRAPVLLVASIDVDGCPAPIKLRNLSENGALIEGDRLPPEGSATCFRRKELELTGRIVWVQGRSAGVLFDRPLNPQEMLRHIPRPKPKVADDFRRPGLSSRPLSPGERKMMEAWIVAPPHGAIGE